MENEKELKEKILKQFSEIGGNFKNDHKVKSLQNKIRVYFREAKTVDIQLLDVLTLLKIYEENLINKNFERHHTMAIQVIERLMNTHISNWDLADLRIAQTVLIYTNDFEEAEELVQKALYALKKNIKDRPTDKIELFMRINMLGRFMVSIFEEIGETNIESSEVEKLKDYFEIHLQKALNICKKDAELKPYELMILTRQAIFNKEPDTVLENLELLKKIGEKEFYKLLKKQFIKYSSNFASMLNQRQSSIMSGGRIRIHREKEGLRVDDFANFLGVTESYINQIERGERHPSLYMLSKISAKLNISIYELIHGREKTYILPNSLGLNENSMKTLQNFIEFLQETEKRERDHEAFSKEDSQIKEIDFDDYSNEN
ncbi:MAG: helix-turn-helix domain-containing protein [Defluviitaleaceae bacterium]|nr:helix-turn-helix domain-containing protein [Defluviitaleaceae bacterium]